MRMPFDPHRRFPTRTCSRSWKPGDGANRHNMQNYEIVIVDDQAVFGRDRGD